MFCGKVNRPVGRKSQTANSKSQAINKAQESNSKEYECLFWKFEILGLFGIWGLGFGISSHPRLFSPGLHIPGPVHSICPGTHSPFA
jgi:hypothetical protein